MTTLPRGVGRAPLAPDARRAGPPPGTWRWWETMAVAGVVSVIVVGLVTLDHTAIDDVAVIRRVTILGSILALVASGLLYLHWRIAGGGPLSWLVLGLSAMAVHLLTMAGLAAADPERVLDRPGLVLVTRVILTTGVLLLGLTAWRGPRLDPLLAGAGLGALLFAGRYVVLVFVPHLNLSDPQLHRLAVIVFLLDLTIAAAIVAFRRAPRWVRHRLAAAMVFLAVAHTVTYPAPSFGWHGAAVAVVGQVAAATILLSLSIRLVRMSIRDNRSAIGILREQLLRTEGVTRTEQARLHEIRATIAGLSNAAQLIHDHHALAPARRAAMSDMMTAEIGRLERLASSRSADPAVELVDLDHTVQPLVERRLAQGLRVTAPPMGASAVGRSDDVAEVVNVLLDNAVRHGGGADLAVSCRRRGDRVEIAVSDEGPGVPPDLRDRIFEWGVSGPGSPGDGIGLHIARELSLEMGGDLRLAPGRTRGATFVLTLPAAPGGVLA